MILLNEVIADLTFLNTLRKEPAVTSIVIMHVGHVKNNEAPPNSTYQGNLFGSAA